MSTLFDFESGSKHIVREFNLRLEGYLEYRIEKYYAIDWKH